VKRLLYGQEIPFRFKILQRGSVRQHEHYPFSGERNVGRRGRIHFREIAAHIGETRSETFAQSSSIEFDRIQSRRTSGKANREALSMFANTIGGAEARIEDGPAEWPGRRS
jgi:hypothetical protein